MIYLSEFKFPDREKEENFRWGIRSTCYDSFYPFFTLSERKFSQIDFNPITILYGGNGSGKTTALNIIAERLGLKRDTLFNRSEFFEDYVKLCDCEVCNGIPDDSRIITSDDVFDFMLNLRCINDGIAAKRADLLHEFTNEKYKNFHMKSLEDYDKLKKNNLAKRSTRSNYVRESVMDNVREHSNGESSFIYFGEKIKENGLYLLDEPENSLSPEKQLELMKFIEDSARFFNCQFVISTHSPFILSLRGAKIYDLDEDPVDIKPWTELKNVRNYYDFFMEHRREFEKHRN